MDNKNITISASEYEFLLVQSKLYENLLLQIKYRLKTTKQNVIALSQEDENACNCEYKRLTKQLIQEMNYWINQEDKEIQNDNCSC